MKVNKLLAGVLVTMLAFTSVTGSVFAANQPEEAAPVNDAAVYTVQSEVIYDTVGDLYDVGSGISLLGMESNSSFSGNYKNQLDATSKKVYEALLAAYQVGGNGNQIELISCLTDAQKVYSVSGTLTGGQFTISKEDEQRISDDIEGYVRPALMALQADHPELSWISHVKCSYGHSASVSPSVADGETEAVYTLVSLSFTLTSGFTYGTAEEISTAVNTAKGSIDVSPGDRYELVKAIHDYLCENIEYNNDAANNPSKYTEAQLGYYQTAYSAFYKVNGESDIKTVCAGYAKAFKILCDSYGIPCILVSGNAGTGGSMEAHMWNYVQMQDNCWYAVDVTWDDQGITDQGNDTRTTYLLSGSATIGFNNTTFDSSHAKSGNWSGGYTFAYPELSQEKYDPAAGPTAAPTAAPTAEPAEPTATPTAAPTAEPTEPTASSYSGTHGRTDRAYGSSYSRTHGRTYSSTHGRTDSGTHGRTDSRTYDRTNSRTYGRTNSSAYGRTNSSAYGSTYSRTHGCSANISSHGNLTFDICISCQQALY